MTTPNWTGYEDNAGTPNEIQADYTVPDVVWTKGGTNYASEWVGMGGFNNTALVQDGVETDQAQSGAQVNFFWWELLPGAQREIGLAVHTNDDVGTEVYDYGGSGGSYEEDFIFCKYTTNNCTDFIEPVSYLHASEAEWIVERTEEDGSYPVLANFGTETFTNATFGTPSGATRYPDAPGYNQLDMTQSGAVSSTPMAVAAPTTTDEVTCTWERPGSVRAPL